MIDLMDTAASIQALIGDAQHRRILRMSFPKDDGPRALLLVNELHATEGMSRDFHCTVQVLSDDATLALKDLQGKNVTIELVRDDGSLRYFNGYVFEFRHVHTDGGYAFYEMVLLPWLAYLRLRRDNHLFHHHTVVEQTHSIFRDYSRVSDWQSRIAAAEEPMTDACQYDETDYNYLHRRWEAKGWYYWYEHRKDGHTLVLCDDSTRAAPIDGESPDVPWKNDAGASFEDDGISEFTPVRRIVPASYALSSFDFKNPKAANVEVPTLNQQGDVLNLEVYEYTGAYGFKGWDDSEEMAKLRMQEIEAQGKHFEAKSNHRHALPGRWFHLTGHHADFGTVSDESRNEFLILEVRHRARNNYLQETEQTHYENRLTCIRKMIPWRPGRGFNSAEPKIYGLQTAIVVGPKGEEIHTDEYGRVRVQFHWDRLGAFDEKSSAWVRVASTWAGSGFGFMAVPRIGQEVLVQFLDGNPDRPLITGRVFNSDNMPPWELPANKTQTGILSRSSHGGSPDNANAIRFEDKKGAEQVWLHAERNQDIEVENDETHWVGQDRSKTIDRDETVRVKHDRTERVDHDERVSVGNNMSLTVEKNRTETIALTDTQGVGIAKTVGVGATYNIGVGKEMSITVGDKFTITVGQSRMVMEKSGAVTITGTRFLFDCSGPVQINGKPIDMN